VAAQIIAGLRGSTTSTTYDGRGICYMEFGRDMIAKVDVTFVSGQAPAGVLDGPSTDLVADKVAFGAERIHRWFNRGWTHQPGAAAR
jgi:sulfide:quinone oxidoreductase